MTNIYKRRPSELLGISDTYTAFCLDEACAYIIGQLEQNKEPKFRTSYSSFTDLYKQYES